MNPSSSPQPSEFQNFQALAKRILTTPKEQLVKPAPKIKGLKLTPKKKTK